MGTLGVSEIQSQMYKRCNLDQNSLPYLGRSLHKWFNEFALDTDTGVNLLPAACANHVCKLLPKYGSE